MAAELNSDTLMGAIGPMAVPASSRCRSRSEDGGEVSQHVTVGLLQKAFTLLDALGCGEVLGASEMARRTGIPKSSTHRVLSMLEGIGAVERQRNGYVSQRQARGAGIRPSAGSTSEIRERVLPALLDVYERTHDTIQFGMLAGTEVLCVERLPGRRSARLPGRVGGTLPAHCTAVGKALLASTRTAAAGTGSMRAFTAATITNRAELQLELANVARTGVAFDRCEFVAGVLCVAAAVLGPDRRPIGAISISRTAERGKLGSVVDAVRWAADVASMSLRLRPAPEVDRSA
jgi:IclR family transcriptional regulator, KDG regulon repressor